MLITSNATATILIITLNHNESKIDFVFCFILINDGILGLKNLSLSSKHFKYLLLFLDL